jgi:uncharacterized phosphatase
MTLYLVRHGKTEYNTSKLYTGSTDVPLSETGIMQARETALLLKDIAFDVIVSSPLLRAKTTAAIIAEFHSDVPVVYSDFFRERSFGDWEGREYSDRSYIDWLCLPENVNLAPDNGEPVAAFYDRVNRGIEKLKTEYPDKTVLLVAHGMVSRMINKAIKGVPFGEANQFLLSNCEYIKYEI